MAVVVLERWGQTGPVTDERTTDVVIIGAGLTGLVAARELSASREVVVLDKGRGVGGRIATRRLAVAAADGTGGTDATAIVDHGVPFLDDDPPGAGGVTRLPKQLATGLDVRTAHRVEHVVVHDGTWHVEGIGPEGQFEVSRASALLVTAPVPQALELLSSSGIELGAADESALRSVRYDPCVVVLAALDGPSGLGADGIRRPSSDVVDLVVDHQLAGASPVPAVTVRATPAASEALWSASDDQVVARLLGDAELGSGTVAGTVQVHRWRYARCATPIRATHLVAAVHPPLVLAGDAFVGPEGATADPMSGLDAARRSGRAAAAAL